MRAVFQTQPEVGHVYLGSKRHLLDRIFDDEERAVLEGAKRIEIGLIDPAKFGRFVRKRFEATDRGIRDEALQRLLEATLGHLRHAGAGVLRLGAHFRRSFAHRLDVEDALGQALRSEHSHFSKIWDDAPASQRLVMLALAAEPTSAPYSELYAERFDLRRSRHCRPRSKLW